jgi:phosphoenolpyruvate---glycerone phosphotransferase subunit DhaL
MESLTERDIKGIFARVSTIMLDNRERLIELDAALGDGDLGITMSSGFAKVAETLQSSNEADVGKMFVQAGLAMAKAVPSTMGTLLASGFMRGGKAVAGKVELALADFLLFMEGFDEGIMARGKAKPGDKTILDSLDPAVLSLRESLRSGSSLSGGLCSAFKAATKGVEDTRGMLSKHGRAAYYQEKSLGHQDPGATVGMLFLKGFADYAASMSGR